MPLCVPVAAKDTSAPTSTRPDRHDCPLQQPALAAVNLMTQFTAITGLQYPDCSYPNTDRCTAAFITTASDSKFGNPSEILKITLQIQHRANSYKDTRHDDIALGCIPTNGKNDQTLLYAFFWGSPRLLNFISRRFEHSVPSS